MKLKRGIALCCTVVMGISLLAGCSASGSDVVAQSGDYKATVDNYNYYYKNMQYNLQQQLGKNYDEIKDQEIANGTTVDAYARQAVENQLKYDIALRELFDENGLTLDSSEIDKKVEATKSQLGEDNFKKSLKQLGVTEDGYRYEVEISLKRELLGDKLFGTGAGVDIDTEVKNSLAENYVRVKHILIKYTDDSGNKLEGDAYTEAENKYKEVKAKVDAGEDFETLITEYGEDPGTTSNPDGYIFTEDDSYDEAFKKKAFELTVGEVGVAESSYGWHIMKRYPSNDDVTLKAKGDEVKETLLNDQLTAKLKERVTEDNIQLNQDIVKKIK